MLSSTIDDEEQSPLNSSTPLDERILDVVRNAKKNDNHRGSSNSDHNGYVVRPALLASELGLSVEEATRELCGLLSAVGGGEDGASFVFERVEMPVGGGHHQDNNKNDGAAAVVGAKATTMVFTFPEDFDKRAKRYRRQSEWRERFHSLSIGFVKAIKVFTAFGLIISLAVLIVAGICLLVAAVIALARGGHGGGGGHRNHPLMHRLRYLFFQLRQILWLYAICGSAVDGEQQDPFMREVAGDLAFMMSICCGNPMHPFFWFRVGGMRRRWARVRHSRGWGGGGTTSSSWNHDNNMDGIAMMRRGTWGDDNENSRSSPPSSFNSSSEQRGLLSIAVEFLFGPDSTPDGYLPALDKWKFRASVIMTLSSTSQGNGVSLRDLLPYVDNPPSSAEDPSAIRETLRIVTYFNGKPVDCVSETTGGDQNVNGMDARFCFPEIVAEMDCQKLLTLGSSEFAPPTISTNDSRSTMISSILYKDDEDYNNFGSSDNSSSDIPDYLYERPFVLTQLSRQQFGQCALLGLLNFVGIIWIQNAMMPGGLLDLSVSAASRTRKRSGGSSGSLIAFAAVLVLKLMHILRFYAGLFFAIPLCRLVIVLIRNYLVEKRNKRRMSFVRAEL
ncbi:hypothetical protein ACHAXR_008293 [Thalassiosira sp. AJA248-18]